MTSTPEQLVNWVFFVVLISAIAFVLGVVWAVCDYGIDQIVRLAHRRRRSNVVEFRRRTIEAHR